MKYLMGNDTAYDEMLAWKIDGCVRVAGHIERTTTVDKRTAGLRIPTNQRPTSHHTIKIQTAPRTSSWR